MGHTLFNDSLQVPAAEPARDGSAITVHGEQREVQMTRIVYWVVVLTAATAACQREADLPVSLAQEVTACDNGDMTAFENAAGAFENGIGVAPDPERAAKLRKQLLKFAQDYCDQGQAHGCSYLGRA